MAKTCGEQIVPEKLEYAKKTGNECQNTEWQNNELKVWFVQISPHSIKHNKQVYQNHNNAFTAFWTAPDGNAFVIGKDGRQQCEQSKNRGSDKIQAQRFVLFRFFFQTLCFIIAENTNHINRNQ